MVESSLRTTHDTVEQISPTKKQLERAHRALLTNSGHADKRIKERYKSSTQYPLEDLLNNPEVYRFYYTNRTSGGPTYQIVSIEYRLVLGETKKKSFYLKTFIAHSEKHFHGINMQEFTFWEQARKKAEKVEAKALVKATKIKGFY